MSVLSFDTLDDRREVWHLLHRLPPAGRVAFLAGRCRLAAPTPAGAPPRPSYLRMRPRVRAAARGCDAADRGLTNEVYADLVLLDLQYAVPLGGTAAALEALTRRGRPAGAPGRPASPR